MEHTDLREKDFPTREAWILALIGRTLAEPTGYDAARWIVSRMSDEQKIQIQVLEGDSPLQTVLYEMGDEEVYDQYLQGYLDHLKSEGLTNEQVQVMIFKG